MENETIARLIKIFEMSTLTLVILLALTGIAMLIMRARSGDATNTPAAVTQKVSRAKRIFKNALVHTLCIAALVAFLPELTYFNYAYYLRYFAGEEIATTTIDPENQRLMRLTNGKTAELFQTKTEDGRAQGIGLKFNDLNEVVTSIHIDAKHEHSEEMRLQIMWRDEEGTPYKFEKRLFMGLPHGYYIPLQPRGKVSELELSLVIRDGAEIHIVQFMLNKPIPFYISGLRLLVLTFILFAIIAVAKKETREKLSYALFQYRFDTANKKQAWVYVATVFLLLVFSWFGTYTAESVRVPKEAMLELQQYNVYLIDALIAGRTWLDFGNSEKILEWERPYDHHWRTENGKIRGIDWMNDWVWYNGKYYCYYGVVPAVILHLPYKLITGSYLSNHASIFIFCAIVIVVLALLWRYCVIRWMPTARFAFFMLGFLTLCFTSNLHTFWGFTRFYSIVQSAGLMFTITGIYILLKSIDKEKIDHALLFFACLCFALIAGCRPNMIFISILLPVLLWKKISWKLVAIVALPYVIVASPLMWYNHIRFDSITEFGQRYALSIGENIDTINLLNPVGRVILAVVASVENLFLPALYSLQFPFVRDVTGQGNIVIHGISLQSFGKHGLINYPIMLCLLYMFAKKFRNGILQEVLPVLYSFLVTAITIMLAIAFLNYRAQSRFFQDFAILIILPSLFCAYSFCYEKKSEVIEKIRIKLIYILMGISIIVGVLISISSWRNQLLYQWLESVLSII